MKTTPETSAEEILADRNTWVTPDPVGKGRGWTACREGRDDKGPFEEWIGEFFPDRDAAIAAALAWPTTEAIAAMREWAKDCAWRDLDPDDIDELPASEIIAGVRKHYHGGLEGFLRDM